MSTEEPEIAGSGIDSDYRCNSEGKGSMVVGRDPLDFEIDLQVDKIWAREYVQSTRFEVCFIK